MKYLLLFIGLLFLIPLISAQNCSYENEINADCNIVVMPLDSNFNRCTSSCKCNLNLYNPSYTILINNVPMNWNNRMKTFYMRMDTNLSVSGIYSVDVNCNALDTNRNIAGQFLVVDRDSNHLLHDINSSLITPSQVWANATRTLTDYNQGLMFDLLFGIDKNVADINVSGGGGGSLTASQVWAYASRTLTGNTTEIQRLYNNLVLQNTARYCASDDIECQKKQAEINPNLDVNTIPYEKQISTTSFLGIEWNPQNIIIEVIVIILFAGLIYWISKW